MYVFRVSGVETAEKFCGMTEKKAGRSAENSRRTNFLFDKKKAVV
jgi:hypothetical protein